MSRSRFEHSGEARAALRAIVSDRGHGAQALASAQLMANLLRDYLPDAPKETGLLIAAVSAGLPATLRGHVAHGMDAGTATSLAAASLEDVTAYAADACEWVAAELAIALGLAGALDQPTADAAGPVATQTAEPAGVPRGPATVGPVWPRSATSTADLAQVGAPAHSSGRRLGVATAFLAAAALLTGGAFAIGYNDGSNTRRSRL